LNQIKQIIKEEVELFIESSFEGQGAADKIYQKQFHIPTDEPNLKAMAGLMGEPIAKVKDYKGFVPIFKNPKSLENFGENARAISDYDGNLYIAQRNGNFAHGSIAVALGFYDDNMMPYRSSEILLLQRQGKTNSFLLSDAAEEKLEFSPEIVLDLLDAVRYKNPQFRFIPERIERNDFD
jgi:hypothetical protein